MKYTQLMLTQCTDSGVWKLNSMRVPGDCYEQPPYIHGGLGMYWVFCPRGKVKEWTQKLFTKAHADIYERHQKLNVSCHELNKLRETLGIQQQQEKRDVPNDDALQRGIEGVVLPGRDPGSDGP